MTDKEKLEKLKKLADAMYYAAQYLTTDASRLHKAMDEYRKFIIYECKEEPVSEDLGEYINELSKQFPEVSFAKLSRIAVRVAKWQKQQIMKDAIDGEIYFNLDALQYRIITEPLTGYHHGDKIKLIIVKED